MADQTELDDQTISPGVPLAPQAPVRTVAVPPAVQPVPMAMARPPMAQRTVAAPTPANLALQQQVQMAQMGDTAQAEQNVMSAIRFQGMRGFQKDISNGMPNAEAFAKWAPTMFMQPKATPGQAASLINATRQRIQNVGGVAYGVNPPSQAAPAGTLTRLPGQDPRTVRNVVNPFDSEEYRSLLTSLRKVEDDLDASSVGPRADEDRGKAQYLRQQMQDIRRRYESAGVPAPGGSPRRITTQEEYNALLSGTVYIGRSGKRYRKP